MAVDKEKILAELKQVYDPEIPVDIVTLGLIYDVVIDGENVDVKMTTTTPACPIGTFIAAEVERVVRLMEGVRETHVDLVYDPPWRQEMISEEGRRMLGWE
jgi:metal-sulfur cluster biosynthetic enzyme